MSVTLDLISIQSLHKLVQLSVQTFEETFGEEKPLRKRTNIVLSRQENLSYKKGVIVVNELEKALEKSFVDDIATFVGPCICDNESCKNFIYKFVNIDYTCIFDGHFSKTLCPPSNYRPGSYISPWILHFPRHQMSTQRILDPGMHSLALESYRGPFNVNVA